MKNKVITKMIAVKRKISITDELKDFIFKNINYRRKVYNDFVEESRKYDNIKDFNPLSYRTKYFNEVEKPNNIYDEYCVGISEQVANDIKNGKKSMKGNKRLYNSLLRFKKYDPFKGAFKVHCKPTLLETSKDMIKPFSRINIFDDETIDFRIRNGYKILINLEESLFDNVFFKDDKSKPLFYNKKQQYYFSRLDVKEISFNHEIGNFYIVLYIEACFIINMNHVMKKKICGIDLGIHNPCMLYDGKNLKLYKFTEKERNRIKYLERRVKKLQHIMDNKLTINNNRKTKNYYKVLKKYRITNRKISNIKLNWRRKIANEISNKYAIVCIDNFKQPSILTHKEYGLSNYAIRCINSSNRLHGTYYLYKTICNFIYKKGGLVIRSPKNSTCICNKCGFMNKKLLLTSRYLICSNCENIIDRDENAAINCYNHLLNS